MKYTASYESPLGRILLASDGRAVTGLWFEGQKHYAMGLEPGAVEKETEAIRLAFSWLDIYFKGRNPGFSVPVHLEGTAFQKSVWQLLMTIPFGKTITYGELASIVARSSGLSHMSAQAVGGAVGRNRISILVPCHRVLGAGGSLTGYAGGVERKLWLLENEGICLG